MGIIVCQDCEKVIEHFDTEKTTVLYGKCHLCNCSMENN